MQSLFICPFVDIDIDKILPSKHSRSASENLGERPVSIDAARDAPAAVRLALSVGAVARQPRYGRPWGSRRPDASRVTQTSSSNPYS